MIVDSFPDRTIIINKKEYLYFGGTAYLGLPTNANFQNTLAKSITKWGSFYGSSRSSNIKLSIFDKTEELFARQIGVEKTLTTSSGTLAGKLVLEYLSKTKNTFYHYPKTHPAILQSYSLPLFENGILHQNLRNNIKEDIVITLDAVLALEVLPTAFNFLDDISPSKQITLVVDESHSIGILGTQGQGIFNTICSKNIKRKIMIASLGKALGISGGIIAADAKFIDTIREEALFVSSSCANPAYLESYMMSQDLIQNQHQMLKDNLAFLFENLKLKDAFKFNNNYPVLYCNIANFYESIKENGIIITNFKYPNYKNGMNRIVITANHTKSDLVRLKAMLVSF
ncbi:aminotransferase class I/II-fold pyridoxal phosphate-dependent enzyme [Oceanihabitans sp. IOP_32]|uniref:aminotransferase class I/II-fold pyridoxal phosphate-dependent enzyme n=1 Tax=Oceanihabitans sp. IOP_32 TaxID=2529032 RepID=UPI0012934CFE|nr:aminotransferase class I/II-fold pyridoxal phosphate-dependent enzyme [Oceanihabitans sp. IOP_32]QFZ54606.1 aminotransferase class I/II-fold pyridoxal phosphate-dependent enzyme [Oceanihabitans sp. IOP_32]